MPRMNIFGELEYTEEELKEIEKQKKEEERKKAEEKAAQERAKAEAKELKRKITEKRKEIEKKLDELTKDDTETVTAEKMELIELVSDSLGAAETLVDLDQLWNQLDGTYNAMKAIQKQRESDKKKADEEKNAKKYKYPFLMYFGHEYRDVTGVFEDGREYTEKQLTKALVEHGFKDFKYAQEIQWEYFEDENCLYPKFKLGNRG